MKKLLPILFVAASIAPAHAATLVVDNQNPRAADTNAGTRELPFKTISSAAKIVKAGDKVLCRPGIYREAVTLSVSGTQNQPIVFESEVPGAAIIDGADVISEFKPESPGAWSFAAADIQKNPYWDDGSFGEWVYVDGAPLERVIDRARLSPGTFWEDYEARRVFVAPEEGRDIKAATVEFARRDGLMSPEHRDINTVAPLDDVQIVGFTLQHNANWFAGRSAIHFRGRRWRIENNRVRWSSWSGIQSQATNGCIVRGNTVDWSGIEAISGSANSHLLIENNTFLHGNWRRGNPNFTGGVSKWALTIDSIVRGNTLAYNYGYGLWFDIHNVGDILEGNICHDNLMGGTLFTEISDDLIIRDNISYNNATGIIIGESPATLVERNIVWNNGNGILMRGDYRRENDNRPKSANFSPQAEGFLKSMREIPDLDPIRIEQYMAKYQLYWKSPKYFMSNNSVIRDNIIFDNNTDYHEHRNYAQPSALDPFVNNFSDDNIFWNSDPHNIFHHSTGAYEGLADWQKASGRDERSVLANPRLQSTLLPDWAKAKREIWSQKFRTPNEMEALNLGLVESPSAALAMARIRRAGAVTPFKMSDSGVKAFVFEVDGQRTLGLWTSQASERRSLRLKLNQNAVTFENPYQVQTPRQLANGAVSLNISHLPIYLRGVGQNISEAPIAELRAASFNLPGAAVPVSASFVNEAKTPAPLEVEMLAPSGFKANPMRISRKLKAGEKWTTKIQLVPDGSFRRGSSQLQMRARIGSETVMSSAGFSVGEGGGKIPLAAIAPVIDGKLDDWQRPQSTLMGVISAADQLASGDKAKWSGPKDLSAKIYSVWSRDALYVAVTVSDDTVIPAPAGGAPWDWDAVEFFLDGRAPWMQWSGEHGQGVYQIGVSPSADGAQPNVRVLSKSALQGLVTSTTRSADGYIIELKIPLSAPNFPAGEWQAGRAVKMSVLINDRDDATAPRESILGWSFSPEGRNYADTSGWKTLILDK